MVIERLARAMHVAHVRGIVHRDLKPGNVLMAGNGSEPKITDFGLAKCFRGEAGQAHTGAILAPATTGPRSKLPAKARVFTHLPICPPLNRIGFRPSVDA